MNLVRYLRFRYPRGMRRFLPHLVLAIVPWILLAACGSAGVQEEKTARPASSEGLPSIADFTARPSTHVAPRTLVRCPASRVPLRRTPRRCPPLRLLPM